MLTMYDDRRKRFRLDFHLVGLGWSTLWAISRNDRLENFSYSLSPSLSLAWSSQETPFGQLIESLPFSCWLLIQHKLKKWSQSTLCKSALVCRRYSSSEQTNLGHQQIQNVAHLGGYFSSLEAASSRFNCLSLRHTLAIAFTFASAQ